MHALARIEDELAYMVDGRDLQLEREGGERARLLRARERVLDGLQAGDGAGIVAAGSCLDLVDDDEAVDEGAEPSEAAGGRLLRVVSVQEEGIGGWLRTGKTCQDLALDSLGEREEEEGARVRETQEDLQLAAGRTERPVGPGRG